MNNLNHKASAAIDLSTPFCAYTYYTGLRAKGCDPIVARGGLHCGVVGDSTRNLHEWAARHDPDGKLRIDYARMMWAVRASDDEVILLGARQS
ncbi:hypothetical protein SAMN05216338_10578 [Bradyrhizobium sp. Rc2d]|nr:hypothetical protein SAMN05216338_10578 [Bradyrhizobium sp. Rc2d]